jgi:predicted nicotinamide N-methyase
MLQPREAVEVPDVGPVEWAPMAPYWTVFWRSGVTLARAIDGTDLRGLRVVELGCGLGVPSIAAARGGATVLATDVSPDALTLLACNGHENGVSIKTAQADWAKPDELVGRGPFDLVLASDLLYERVNVGLLLRLLPLIGSRVWLADPGRPAAEIFLEHAAHDWSIETSIHDVVSIHRLRLAAA